MPPYDRPVDAMRPQAGQDNPHADDRPPPCGCSGEGSGALGWPVTRRGFIADAGLAGGAALMRPAQAQTAAPVSPAVGKEPLTLAVNGTIHTLEVDPRTTLLDLLRETLGLTGTKKGCDHGQCGACTVLVNGRRINSCLSMAMLQDDAQVTTIEGLAQDGALHPLQAAFIEHDGFQCGYCTPGQICSAVGMLDEARHGMPSHVSADVRDGRPVVLDVHEIRERLSGNICRCGAYPGIVAAVQQVATVAMPARRRKARG